MSPRKVRCAGCGSTLRIPQTARPGDSLQCPQCRTALRVPTTRPGLDDPSARSSRQSIKPAAGDAICEGRSRSAGGARRLPENRERKLSPGLVIGLVSGVVVLLGGAVAVAVVVALNGTGEDQKQVAGNVRPVPVQPMPGPGVFQKPQAPGDKSKPAVAVADWLQDVEKAKRQAAKANKDILLLFEGSDWCVWSQRLTKEVLSTAEFQNRAKEGFVLVVVDFPHKAKARAKVHDARRNERLADEYDIEGFPTLVLLDAQGRPYATQGYKDWGAALYTQHLSTLQGQRATRDSLLSGVKTQRGAAKLWAARQALSFLDSSGFNRFYAPQLAEWLKVAREFDPTNTKGDLEVFFESDWLVRAGRMDREDPTPLIKDLDTWKSNHHFKDPDRAASLHLVACRLLAAAGQQKKALEYAKAGLKYGPINPVLQRYLEDRRYALGFGSGSGFVVAPGGLVLTNYHVIKGPGRVLVRLPGVESAAPAEVVAQDDRRDMALLRVRVPEGTELRPLAIRDKLPLERGDEVAAFGYPLGDWLGGQIKLVRGVISATPEADNENRLLLDVKVNPGNSGGPLCDAGGNVVGLVTAKSYGGGAVDSYGLALPARDLDGFLKKHIKNYRAAAPSTQKGTWAQVNRQVSGSVLMILKASPPRVQHSVKEDDFKSPR